MICGPQRFKTSKIRARHSLLLPPKPTEPARGEVEPNWGRLAGLRLLGGGLVVLADERQCFCTAGQPAIELRILDRPEDLPKLRSRSKSHLLEIVATHQTRRPDLRWRGFCQELADELVSVEHSVTGQAIEPMKLQVLFKPRQAHKPLQRRRAHFEDVLEAKMVCHQGGHLLGVVI